MCTKTLQDVLIAPVLIGFSEAMYAANDVVEHLREQLYRHYQVVRMTTKAQRIIRKLSRLLAEPRCCHRNTDKLPRQRKTLSRATADYIAGMTDRYAVKEHRRLFLVGDKINS